MDRIGLYPGTFDPLTFGHLDIIRRGLKLVDKLIIAVGENTAKTPLFSAKERVEMIRAETAALEDAAPGTLDVICFDELLMDLAKRVGATAVIRGLRAVSDFEYEFQLAGMNAELAPDVETLFLMADVQYQPIASRLVKEIAIYGGDITPFVPEAIAKRVAEQYKK